MKNIICIIICVLSLSACSIMPQSKNETYYLKNGYEQGKIILSSIDGCGWMILLDNKKLEPTNLPEKFQKENILVWVKYQPEPTKMSICMAGKIVKIIDIKKR